VGEIRVGTSGWNYPSGRGTWNGVFYPARRPRGFDELRYYAEHFDTVEVNSTFYRMPESGQTQRWIERTPPNFLLSVKLFQKFTHPDMYLAREGVTEWDLSREDVDLFRRGIDPISAADRLGAILIQFPPSFHNGPETRAYLEWLMDSLAGYPLAVELRHRTWSDAATDTEARLTSRRTAWVIIDEPKFQSSIRQTLGRTSEAVPATPPLVYMRLHGRNAAAWWDHEADEDRYNYLYSPAELRPFAAAAQHAAASGRRVLVYLNNHFSAKAVANAAVLRRHLGQTLPGDYPPEMISRYPDLAGLVTTSGGRGLPL
jgi:uncharacterized protein YecE (DUF72 family)